MADERKMTAKQAGLSGDEQIHIALEAIAASGGAATMDQIYLAVEERMGGARLSEQGRASLRNFINERAVRDGHVYPYHSRDPGWRITPQGRDYIRKSAALGSSILDAETTRQLRAIESRLEEEKKLPSQAQLAAYYAAFQNRFGPERLKSLDGEALLNLMHDLGNRDSLVYWLAFKNDEEFPALFGGIGARSALVFRIYGRKETGAWMTGSSLGQRELKLDEAVRYARIHRDELVRGAELLATLPDNAGDAEYQRLQEQMNAVAPTISNLAWGHKYFYLLHPDRLDDFHNPDYQRFHLIRLLQTPPEGQGRYLCAGRYVAIAKELGMPMNHLTAVLNERNGRPHRYWRILARYQNPHRDAWPTMRDGACVAIGWANLPDLSGYVGGNGLRDALANLFREHYPAAPKSEMMEVLHFATRVAQGDVVIAASGDQVLGVGRVTGEYIYQSDTEFPHRRPVEWLPLDEWNLPEPDEGRRPTVAELRNVRNLAAIERAILGAPQVVRPPHRPTPVTAKAVRLSGVPGRIQSILERKGQVILYGPPGTGKTYWAQQAAQELAAQHTFGKPFAQLTADEHLAIDESSNPERLVRMCSFHPGYGYEEFIEGYRPEESNGQMLFVPRDGVFKKLCQDALARPEHRFYLIVDEINRGDVPRIFGELLTLLEKDKRGRTVVLPLSREAFVVPPNVYLIGTMNTADRSIALLDTALRRRFGFIELMPDPTALQDAAVGGIPLAPWLESLNQRICQHLGHDARNRQIGHAYLLENGRPINDLGKLARVVQEDIIPLLQEYCYEDYSLLEKLLGSSLLDMPAQRVREELFEPVRELELVQALLAPCPEITTSGLAIAADAGEGEAETADDGESPEEEQ